MKKRSSTLLAVGLLLVAALATRAKAQQTIDFCNFELPSTIVRGNASFTTVYAFDVDRDGTPANIQSVEKGFAKSEDVQKCIADWKLPDYAHKHLVASFEWRHALGWTKLGISGEGVNVTILLSGKKCPYCAKSTGVPAEKTKPTPTTH